MRNRKTHELADSPDMRRRGVHDRAVLVVSPRTRIPVEPWRIGYSEIRSIEQKGPHEGMRPGTKVLLGIGIGLGVTMLLAGIAIATAY